MGNTFEGKYKRNTAITYSRPDMMENTGETIHCKYMDERFTCDKECNKLLEMITPFYSDGEVAKFKMAYFHNKMCKNILVVENVSAEYDKTVCVNLDMLK